MTVDMEHLFNAAIEAVHRGMNIILHPPIELDVHTEANRNDPVTAVDRAIEADIAPHPHAATGLPLLGEEGHAVDSFAGFARVFDPTDGTMNYVETHRDYAVSSALCEDGILVLGMAADVVVGRTYHAIRGQGVWVDGVSLTQTADVSTHRDAAIITDIKEILALPRLARVPRDSRGYRCYGSAAFECTEAVVGRAGASAHMWVLPWNIATATLIVIECGALTTCLDGVPFDVRHKGPILLGVSNVHATLAECLMSSVQ